MIRFCYLQNDIASKQLYVICNVIHSGNFCDKIVDDGRSGRGNVETAQVNFRKPVGVAALNISNQFTFRGGKAQASESNPELSCPFVNSQSETETLHQTFQRLLKDSSRLKGTDDKLVIELNVVFGGAAAHPVNKHVKCHHHNRNHHRQIQKLRLMVFYL